MPNGWKYNNTNWKFSITINKSINENLKKRTHSKLSSSQAHKNTKYSQFSQPPQISSLSLLRIWELVLLPTMSNSSPATHRASFLVGSLCSFVSYNVVYRRWRFKELWTPSLFLLLVPQRHLPSGEKYNGQRQKIKIDICVILWMNIMAKWRDCIVPVRVYRMGKGKPSTGDWPVTKITTLPHYILTAGRSPRLTSCSSNTWIAKVPAEAGWAAWNDRDMGRWKWKT